MQANQRTEFLRKLRQLTPDEFSLLRIAVPGAASEVSRDAPVSSQVAQLVEWSESTNGLGLDEVRYVYQAVLETSDSQGDPALYLQTLLEKTAYIDIRGLQTGTGRVHRFPIDEIYIPLSTASLGPERRDVDRAADYESQRIDLDRALEHRQLVIIGDPGAGKTTFLNRIASRLCRAHLSGESKEDNSPLGLAGRPLPLMIRLAELAEHIRTACGRADAPTRKNSLAWLAHFLATVSREQSTGLDERFFLTRLADGSAVFLLDGLDEAPTQQARELLTELVVSASCAYRQCRFVVTSRPAAHRGRSVLAGFHQVRIEALEDDAIQTFLQRWCEALFEESPTQLQSHFAELSGALQSRGEILRLARNPVMLTALAVLHWNEKRLPEQRADLYESIISWLSRSREQRAGRLTAKRCVTLLQDLALRMQNHRDGRQTQVSKRWAAEQMAGQFREAAPGERVSRAEEFLSEEEVDSGIVVGRGKDVTFWHLTFQEYLTARAIAAMSEQSQLRLLLGRTDLFDPAWREVLLLLAGVLHEQGAAKVDNLFSALIDEIERPCRPQHALSRMMASVARIWKRSTDRSTLTARARCAGLLGAALDDLAPVGYVPEERFQRFLASTMGIFERTSRPIPIEAAIEAAEALGSAGDPRFSRSHLDQNWVTIPAGEFWMGAQDHDPARPNHDPEAFAEESPVHKVLVDAYRIGRYPVTVGEYRRFVDEGGYQDDSFWEAGGFGETQEPEGWQEQLRHSSRPVVRVSWYEAAAYACWAGCRLPTEAEWERAGRGLDARKYPWGDGKPTSSLLNYNGNVGHPTPVGVYPRGATPEGICDLAGNVWEWCSDWHGAYSADETKNPRGPNDGQCRVVRGGGWRNVAGRCRCSYRANFFHPTNRSVGLGFRVVLFAARTLKRKP